MLAHLLFPHRSHVHHCFSRTRPQNEHCQVCGAVFGTAAVAVAGDDVVLVPGRGLGCCRWAPGGSVRSIVVRDLFDDDGDEDDLCWARFLDTCSPRATPHASQHR